ncbi:hypothetical protein BC829DRAFT_438833 [Chytridium lagenaria]|nr:hypothetical protein BC829DRAFT_438833 [Chytridium lagenaria]
MSYLEALNPELAESIGLHLPPGAIFQLRDLSRRSRQTWNFLHSFSFAVKYMTRYQALYKDDDVVLISKGPPALLSALIHTSKRYEILEDSTCSYHRAWGHKAIRVLVVDEQYFEKRLKRMDREVINVFIRERMFHLFPFAVDWVRALPQTRRTGWYIKEYVYKSVILNYIESLQALTSMPMHIRHVLHKCDRKRFINEAISMEIVAPLRHLLDVEDDNNICDIYGTATPRMSSSPTLSWHTHV